MSIEPQQPTAEDSFARFHNYDWTNDDDFKTGLARIQANLPPLQSTTTGTAAIADLEAIEFKAKTFFFDKKFGIRINQSEYNAWVAGQGHDLNNNKNDNNNKDEGDPPYSLKYHEIVDLILNNKPIPGIKHIPDTVLGLDASTKSTQSHRCKPWEKATDPNPAEPTAEQ